MPTTSRLRAPRDASPTKISREHNNTTASRVRSSLGGDNADDFPDTRKTKRQKLEIRGPKQQTLDSFVARAEPIKPPIKVTELAPGEPITETVNGVQHGLSHLQTNGTAQHDVPPTKKQRKSTGSEDKPAKAPEEKRTLRSQDDGPRLKSELATYFSNYEDIIFDTNPQEPELLNVDSTLFVTVEQTPPVKQKIPSASPTVRRSTRESFPRLELDFSMYKLVEGEDDPLTDAAFAVAHKRAERKEKQMRNIEREHAMHEKAQLDRLLDGLLGHDWLRVLGITGVTEGEAKKFESKRRYFIQEVQGLVDKFKEWREEERRQRLEKAAAEREALLEEGEDEDEDEDDQTEISTSNPPSSDLNASASRQLQQETASAMKKLQQNRQPPAPPIPFRPPSPITSFYSARHLRDSALKKARNSRNQLAFGLPLPEVDEEDFTLPPDYLSEEVLKAKTRESRRRKREKVANHAA